MRDGAAEGVDNCEKRTCRRSLAGHFDGQTCPFLLEILRESSTRCEEHSYDGAFHFHGWIVRSVVERLNLKTFIECIFLLKKINYKASCWELNR